MIVVTDRLRERFEAKIARQGGCWIWTGHLKEDGYPNSMSVGGKQVRVSHIALALVGKPRPSDEMLALHSCDNPPCVNPAHLRWGTEVENTMDAIARWKGKGRSFSPDEVRAIRSSPLGPAAVAKQYGVSCACITNIRAWRTHKHVE